MDQRCSEKWVHKNKSIDDSGIQICTNFELRDISLAGKRTGSESILPKLKRFWELNLNECENTDCYKNREYREKIEVFSTSSPDLMRMSQLKF